MPCPETESTPIHAARASENGAYPAAVPIQRTTVAAMAAARIRLPASITVEAYLHIFLRVDRSPFMGIVRSRVS